MGYAPDYHFNARALAAQGAGFNPDGRHDGRGLDMDPRLFRKMLRGEISPQQAEAEWKEREPRRRAANDEIRRKAGLGYVADAASVLPQDGATEGTAPTVRDAQSGTFRSLNEAAREAGHQTVPGSLVPQERAETSSARRISAS